MAKFTSSHEHESLQEKLEPFENNGNSPEKDYKLSLLKVFGIVSTRLRDPFPNQIICLQNRYMKKLFLEQDQVQRCRIECQDLNFPMKFECDNTHAQIVVLLDLDRQPNLNKF